LSVDKTFNQRDQGGKGDSMDEAEWNIEEVKRLKKKQLIQSNLVLLLLFILFGFYVENGGTATVVFGVCCVLLWIFVANAIYTLLTGKTMGTKSIRRVLAFDIDHIGKKRWKRRKLIEFIIIIVVCLGITVVLFTIDFGSKSLDFPLDAFPFI
jgi:uncharacterized membrane protein YwzB